MQRWIIFLLAAALGTALDLGSKEAAFEHLPRLGSSIPVTSWFSLAHATNRGAAFGLFQGKHTFFMLVSVVAFTAIPYFVHTAPRAARAVPAVLGLVLAGVTGNFWDRIVEGHVRDFLDIHAPPDGALYDACIRAFGTSVWPTFNVADIFITCGAVLLILLMGRGEHAPAEAAPGAPPASKADPAPAVASAAAPAAPEAPPAQAG